MNKEQILALFDKIQEVLNSKTAENWPDGIFYELPYDEKRISKIQFPLKRCIITIWESTNHKGLSIQFSVKANFINGAFDAPNVFMRWFCPVWRKWKKIKHQVIELHRQNKQLMAQKELEEQIAVFNELYYTQFPDDIDDILLDDED